MGIRPTTFALLSIVIFFGTSPVGGQQDFIQKLKSVEGDEQVAMINQLSGLGIQSEEAQKFLLENLKAKDIKVRGACVDAIPYVCTATPEVINSILDSMDNKETVWPDGIPYMQMAAQSLEKIGPEAIPFAIKRINTENFFVYVGTMDYLHRMGEKAAGAVPQLVAELKPGKKLWSTVYALGGIGPKAKEATDELIKLLDSDDFNVVCIACRALAGIGPAAKKAKKRLLEVVEKGNVSERGRALQALGGIGVAADEDVRPIIEANLKAFHQTICERTMMGIGKVADEKSKAFIPVVLEAIKSPKFKSKPVAAMTLYKIGGPLDVALKTLEESLKNPTFEVDVISKFGEMGKDAKDSLPKLLPYLDSEDDYLRAVAIESIAKIAWDEETENKLKVISQTGEYLSARAARVALAKKK